MVVILSMVLSALCQNTVVQKSATPQNQTSPCICRMYAPKCKDVCFQNVSLVEGTKKPEPPAAPVSVAPRAEKPFINLVERNIDRNPREAPVMPGMEMIGDTLFYNGAPYRACDMHEWASRNYASREYLNLHRELQSLYEYVRTNLKNPAMCNAASGSTRDSLDIPFPQIASECRSLDADLNRPRIVPIFIREPEEPEREFTRGAATSPGSTITVKTTSTTTTTKVAMAVPEQSAKRTETVTTTTVKVITRQRPAETVTVDERPRTATVLRNAQQEKMYNMEDANGMLSAIDTPPVAKRFFKRSLPEIAEGDVLEKIRHLLNKTGNISTKTLIGTVSLLSAIDMRTTTLTVEKEHTTTVYRDPSPSSIRPREKESRPFVEATQELIKGIFDMMGRGGSVARDASGTTYKELVPASRGFRMVDVAADIPRPASVGAADLVDKTVTHKSTVTSTLTLTEVVTKTKGVRTDAATSLSTRPVAIYPQTLSPVAAYSSAIDEIRSIGPGPEMRYQNEIKEINERLMTNEERERGLINMMMALDKRSRNEENILELLKRLHVAGEEAQSRDIHLSSISPTTTQARRARMSRNRIPRRHRHRYGGRLEAERSPSRMVISSVMYLSAPESARSEEEADFPRPNISMASVISADSLQKHRDLGMPGREKTVFKTVSIGSTRTRIETITAHETSTATVYFPSFVFKPTAARKRHSTASSPASVSCTTAANASEPSSTVARPVLSDSAKSSIQTVSAAVQKSSQGTVALDDVVLRIREKRIPDDSVLISDSSVIDSIVERLLPLAEECQTSSQETKSASL